MKRFVRENSLSLFFLALFLAALAAQSFAGWHAYNADQHNHGETAISYWGYVTSSSFGRAVLENWQSEYLQFTLYIMATIWFIQKGSSESKKPGEEGPHVDTSSRFVGWRDTLYSNSLLILMVTIWLGSWIGQALTGWSSYNSEQLTHHRATHDFLGYLGTAEFWEATLQNWQSEFLAVGSFAVFAIYLRQRGSPESKPVGAPDEETGA
jgi:Domain of unknown function (DUF6766)